jgi:hypothetical protein
MKLTLYALLGFTSFVGGSTIKQYIELGATNDAMYAPIFAAAGTLLAIMITNTIVYDYLGQLGNQKQFGEVLRQVLTLKVAILGAGGGLAAMAIVKLAFTGG